MDPKMKFALSVISTRKHTANTAIQVFQNFTGINDVEYNNSQAKAEDIVYKEFENIFRLINKLEKNVKRIEKKFDNIINDFKISIGEEFKEVKKMIEESSSSTAKSLEKVKEELSDLDTRLLELE